METIGIEEVAGYVTSTYRDIVPGVNWGERVLPAQSQEAVQMPERAVAAG